MMTKAEELALSACIREWVYRGVTGQIRRPGCALCMEYRGLGCDACLVSRAFGVDCFAPDSPAREWVVAHRSRSIKRRRRIAGASLLSLYLIREILS